MSPDPEPRPVSALAPLRRPFFRALWIATLFSNIGTWVQSVGAAWLMTSLAPSADMVALVQSATALPTLAFSLAAGAVADIWDRRAVLLIAQGWMLAAAAVLAAMTYSGQMTPGLLLALTFLLGAGAAFYGPTWQASVGDLVPRDELATAIAVNSVGFNIARSIGPAIGGLIVAAAGAEAAFLLNAICYLAIIGVLIAWRREVPDRPLPRERLFGAIAAGLRYTRRSPGVRNMLLRALVFGFAASAVWALLPVLAKRDPAGGPLVFGLMLGALGAGAVLGAAVIVRVRRKLGSERMIDLASILFGATSLALAFFSWLPAVFAMLLLGGGAWLAALSTLNISVQTAVSSWVKARVLSLYMMCVFGGIALGSWVWGHATEFAGLQAAFAAAGALLLASPLLSFIVPLGRAETLDLRVAPALAEPRVAAPVEEESGPVLVRVEYRIDPADLAEFQRTMHELRRVRLRDGAVRWGLYQDVEDPGRWVELFRVGTWLEHLRQHGRVTMADRALIERARAFHRGEGPPTVSHLIRREPEAGVEPVAPPF